MRISVPTEVKNNEYRVALTPAGVHDLVQAGHEVFVQRGAGDGSSMPDAEYEAAGAIMLEDAADVWARAELLLKVKEPIASEYGYFRDDLVLFTYLHLAADRPLTDRLVADRVTAIAYETVQLAGGGLPLLAPMSEVAGRLAPTVGAATLMRSAGGIGLLMSGVPGTRPARVTIIGGGVAGANAAIIAAGLGSDVTIFDTNIQRLRFLDDHFQARIKTAASNPLDLDRAVVDSDLVIGSVLIPGAKAPKLVTNDMVSRMKPGSVLVDIAVDQGGCFEDTQADDPRRSDIPRARQHLLLRRQHARSRPEHVDVGSDQRHSPLHPADRAPRMEGRPPSGCRPRRWAEHRRRHDREPGRRDRARPGARAGAGCAGLRTHREGRLLEEARVRTQRQGRVVRRGRRRWSG